MTEEREATVCIDIDADAADVWRALTTEDGLAGWMGPGSTLAESVDGELDLTDITTGVRRQGRVREVEAERSISYTWWPGASPEDPSEVQITLEPTETGTRVTVVESVSPVSSSRQVSASAQVAVAQGAWAWRAALLVVATAALASCSRALAIV